jgi:hypothetical protein
MKLIKLMDRVSAKWWFWVVFIGGMVLYLAQHQDNGGYHREEKSEKAVLSEVRL